MEPKEIEMKVINKELAEKWLERAWWSKGKTTLKELIEEIWRNGHDTGWEECQAYLKKGDSGGNE